MRILTYIAITLMLFASVSKCVAAADPSKEAFRDYRAALYGFGEGLGRGVLLTGKSGSIRTEANAHDLGKTDKIELITLPGVELRVRRIPTSEVPVIELLIVKRTGFALPLELRVGSSTQKDVEDTLGRPDKVQGATFFYDGLAESCSDNYSFHFEHKSLVRIEWHWCAD